MTLPFGSSQRSTIGVEWELQLVDRDSHDLRQSADAIVDRATVNGQLYPGIHREMLLNTIEVVSKPRSTVAECVADLTRTCGSTWPPQARTPSPARGASA